MAGIKIDFVSDVSKFIAGTRDVEGAIDQVGGSLDELARDAQDAGDKAGDGLSRGVGDGARDAERSLDDVGRAGTDSLDDVARSAKDAGDDIDRGITDGTREAERSLEDVEDTSKRSFDDVADHAEDAAKETETASERMERSFREAFDAAKKESKTTSDDVSSNTKRGMREAEDATDTFKNEARQNLSESVSSFRGDVEDIPQLVQDVFGGVAADLGPAGLVGGTLVAAGIGVGVAYLQGTTEKAAEVKAQLLDLASQIRDVDGDLSKIDLSQLTWDWATEIGNAKQFFEVWQSADYTNMELATKAAEELGITVNEMMRAMLAPESADAKQLLADINERILAIQGHRFLDEEVLALRRMKEALETGELSTADAAQIHREYEAAIAGTTVAALDAADAEEALREQRNQSRDATRSLYEAEINYAAQVEETSNVIEENGEATDINTEAGRQNRQAILDQADASRDLIQAFLDQGGSTADAADLLAEHRQALIDSAEQAGYSEQAARDYADELLGVPGEIHTDFEVNTAAAQEDINYFISRNTGRKIRVDAIASTTSDSWQSGSMGNYTYGDNNSGGYIKGYASGGHVGSDIDDRVNARLSPGEYVMDAQATQQIGPGVLDMLNNGQTPGGRQPVEQDVHIHLTNPFTGQEIEAAVLKIVNGAIREHHKQWLSSLQYAPRRP